MPEKLEKIRRTTMSSDSEEDCITLEALSEDDLRSIALNPKYRQLLSELLGNERQPEDIRPDDSVENEMGISEGSVADPTTSDAHSEDLVADPASSLPRDTALDRASPSSLGKRSSSVDEEQPPAKKQKMNPEAGCSTTKVFDPILAGSEEDEYHFKPHKVVKDYLETHFRRCLSKKERKAMLKADPKPDCEAMTTPEVDDFLQTFWKGKINNTQDGDLKQIQTALLNGAAPFCGLWSQLIDQGMEKESDLVPVPVVLDMIQRTLVFLGSANNLLSEKRRSAILHSVDPKLARYAKGDFPNAGKCLFGQGFVKEVVSQVEADTAIYKASALASKASRELQTRKGPFPVKSTFFREGRTGGYGAGPGRNVFNPYNRKAFRGRGSFRQDRHQSVFSRLGQHQSPTEKPTKFSK